MNFYPFPAGVLENQDTLGGGEFEPPPLNLCLMSNIKNNTSLESSYTPLLESAKKIANLRKLIFWQNPVEKLKCLCKKCPEIDKIYILKNP